MQAYRRLIKGEQVELCTSANMKEIARLAQGQANKSIEVINRLFFKHPKIILLGRKATYIHVLEAY